MENINIVINKETRMIQSISKSVIGNEGENLQENLIFTFEDTFVDGQARLELQYPNNTKNFITITKEGESYQIPVKSVITKEGRLYMQLVITEGSDDEEIPIFKSNVFYMIVNSSINAVGEAPDGYAQWIDIANTKLNEIDNLNIEATKTGNTATITITRKDGTEESVQIFDGEEGPQGPQGPAGQIRFIVVNTLPTEDIDTSAIYLVPSETTTTGNTYAEYIYVNNNWEKLGEVPISPDLTDYVKNTDYANSSKGGVFKTGNGVVANSSGIITPDIRSYSDYGTSGNNLFISKGTLENVITGKGLVSNTNYATQSTAGVIKVGNGNNITQDGVLYPNAYAYSTYVNASGNLYISKGTLENVLDARIGNIQTLLDNLDIGAGV